MSRREHARDAIADLRLDRRPTGSDADRWRYLLVQQYADAGRGIQHAVMLGDDVDALLSCAMNEVWDGWLPTTVYDLDHGTTEAIKLAPVRDSSPQDRVTVVDVDGRHDGPYLFRRDDHARQFAAAVGADRCSTYDGLIVEPDEAAAVIASEAQEDDEA